MMTVALTYGLGDIVTLKKPHACGENRWCIIRMGMDIRVKCTKCDHSVLIPRQRFDRILRKVLIAAERTPVSEEEEND